MVVEHDMSFVMGPWRTIVVMKVRQRTAYPCGLPAMRSMALRMPMFRDPPR